VGLAGMGQMLINAVQASDARTLVGVLETNGS
jgi:ABC-type dipeptide/oligopeptide/nickel transport system permease component